MGHLIGLDIGGTKIAGGVFTCDGTLLHELVVPAPHDYALFVQAITNIVKELEAKVGSSCQVGVSMVGAIDHENYTVCSGNLPCIVGPPVFKDIEEALGTEIRYANDANCSALAEAIDGAGKDDRIVLGLIMGTGFGSGLIVDKKIVEGPNGLTGEIGHVSMPHNESSDGPTRHCGCGLEDCIETYTQGAGLAKLYTCMTGNKALPPEIADKARAGDKDALNVLDRYYEIVAKALTVAIHTIDPHVIVVSGGLNSLPNMYEEVPKRWGKYCVTKNPKTRFTPATHGPMAGMRGAAYLWRE